MCLLFPLLTFSVCLEPNTSTGFWTVVYFPWKETLRLTGEMYNVKMNVKSLIFSFKNRIHSNMVWYKEFIGIHVKVAALLLGVKAISYSGHSKWVSIKPLYPSIRYSVYTVISKWNVLEGLGFVLFSLFEVWCYFSYSSTNETSLPKCKENSNRKFNLKEKKKNPTSGNFRNV